MSRFPTLFVLSGAALLLAPLTASAQFRPPFGIPGAPAFRVPFAPPVVAPLPVYSVLPSTITNAFPQYTLYRQFYPGPWNGGVALPSLPSNTYQSPTSILDPRGGAALRPDIVAIEQANLARAQQAATEAASVAPTGTARAAAQGGVLGTDSAPLPAALNPAAADAASIKSGAALNNLLKAITDAEAKGAKGPSAYIPPLLIKDIRFAGTPSADLLNFARQDALDVPSVFGANGADATKAFVPVAEALRAGKAPDAARVGQLNAAFVKLDEASATALKGASEADTSAAKEFLTRFGGAVKTLVNGGAAGLFEATWATEGLTGDELVRYMAKHKLQFGPALPGAAESYETLHRNLSTYLFVLTKKK